MLTRLQPLSDMPTDTLFVNLNPACRHVSRPSYFLKPGHLRWDAPGRGAFTRVAAALLCLLLAFGFLGSRGIWDPDEGRYTNVALTMLSSGDWLNPMRNGETGHWTKPPVTYWLIAASVSAFGRNPWAARLPIALSYLACVLLTGLCARRLAKGSETTAAVVYATMLMPAGASQLVTTDFPLAALQALAMFGFVEYRFGEYDKRSRGWMLMWGAIAAAFMTKGPPALLPLLAIGALGVLVPGRSLSWRWHAAGVALFLLLALPWFLMVILKHDGLASYFLGTELVERVASNRFHRNGEWYGWIGVYAPTLLLGTLPWTAGVLPWARVLPAQIGRWRDKETRKRQAPFLLLFLWIALPLLVFCAARSRLPLYLLPLFVPIAVAIAARRQARGLPLPARRWLILWVGILLGLRIAAAAFPTHKDASNWAEAIRARARGPITEVIFVEDMARYGLNLHLGAEVEKVARTLGPQSRFDAKYDEPLLHEVEESNYVAGLVFITKEDLWPELERMIDGQGYRAQALGTPYRGRIIFSVLAREVARPGDVSSAPSKP